MTRLTKHEQEERDHLALEDRRRCRACDQVKTLSTDFTNQTNGAHGKSARCKTCEAARQRQRARREHGYQGRLDEGKKRFVEAGRRAYSITAEELVKHLRKVRATDPMECYYCGRYLDGEPYTATHLNLDHVVPLSTPGSRHSKKNIVPACRACNQHKGTKRAAVAVLTAPEELRPVKKYNGLLPGHSGIDADGNPLAPAQVEWSDSDHAGEYVVYVPQVAEVTQ